MKKKFYTIDDLYRFCRDNQFEKFSSIKHGAPLIIQSIEVFESNDNISDGFLPVKLKSCHTGKNANKSGISDDVMNECKNSFQGRPILGAIYQTDTGEYEFRSHDMEIIQNEDGEAEVEYIEQPIGVISEIEEPYLEFDEKLKKNFLMVSGKIFADYSRAAEILQRRRTCKCSVEIAIEEMSYNCADDYLSIDKFQFRGVTILGYQQDGVTEIQEGMKGSKITIDDFSEQENSMFFNNYQSELIKVLNKLDSTLSNFNMQEIQKGGNAKVGKFEELLEKYEVKAEDITFETEGLSDEELEAAFEEAFGEGDTDTDTDTNVDANMNADTDTDDTTDVDGADDGNDTTYSQKKGYAVDEEGNVTISFEISHEDIRGALYNLLAIYEEEDNEWYWVANVYDSYFIFENWYGDKLYKQEYSVDGDNVSLSGDRQQMFKMILTESEKLAIDKMREDYAALESKYNELKEFKEQYDAAELKAKKDEIFEREEYSILADDEAFKNLLNEAEKFSVEEVESKVKSIFADHVIKVGAFSVKNESKKDNKAIAFNFTEEKKEKAYGGLFD